MNCQEYEQELMDIARGVQGADERRRALLRHVEECERCDAYLREQRALTLGLRALSERSEVPSGVAFETRLLEEFRAEVAPGGPAMWSAFMKAAAVLAAVAAGLLFAWGQFSARQDSLRQATVAPASAFVPWPGAAALPPFESGELVRTELPASVLPVLGIDPPAGSAAASVTADLLVGQDGLVRAVRLAN